MPVISSLESKGNERQARLGDKVNSAEANTQTHGDICEDLPFSFCFLLDGASLCHTGQPQTQHPLAPTSSAGITGLYYHTQLGIVFLTD